MSSAKTSNSQTRARYPSQYRDRQVRAKSREIVDYHYDTQKPGKPLWLLIPGALVALGALALGVLVLLLAGAERISQTLATFLLGGLAFFYIGGVFIFSYGYELYDLGKALRLTAIIVFITFAAVFMLAVLVVVLGAVSGGKSRSSSSSESRSSSSGGGGAGGGGGLMRGLGPIFLGNLPNIHINPEVVRQVPVAPSAPEPLACAYCGKQYLPEATKFACPNCGAPAPADGMSQE